MITTSTDGPALLAAIAAQPDEDTPRLAYADWLDEQGPARVKCWACMPTKPGTFKCGDEKEVHCPTCSGNGTVLDTANADRAEFIRVQVELDRLGYPSPNTEQVCGLAFREHDLLKRYERDWRAAGPCPRCEGSGDLSKWDRKPGGSTRLSRPCPTCFGTGDVGGFLRKFEYVDIPHTSTRTELVHVTFRRGFPDAVEVPTLADVGAEVSGRWVPSPWARAVVRWHPVTRFVVRDRTPYHHRDPMFTADHVLHGLYRWGRRSAFGDDNTDLLPNAVFDAIPKSHPKDIDVLRYFKTAELATDALARALATLVRREEYSTKGVT